MKRRHFFGLLAALPFFRPKAQPFVPREAYYLRKGDIVVSLDSARIYNAIREASRNGRIIQ